MNKIILCAIGFLASLGLAACAPKPVVETPSPVPVVSPAAINVGELKELSVKLSEQMAAGEFEPMTELLSNSVKDQLTVEVLKTTWDGMVAEIGTYENISDCANSPANGYIIINVTLKYEKNDLVVCFMYDYDGKIDGFWMNYGILSPVLRSNDIFEEIAIQIGKNGIKLDGILTLPKGETKATAVFVHGSGQTDMDETIGATGNKPFRDIAHGLAEEGIASIRYNKRFFQYPELATADLTIKDEVLDDAGYAIDYIESNRFVRGTDIILIGHSLGGMLAPKIALDNDRVAAVIALAGSPRNLEDIIFDQNMDVISQMDTESKEAKENSINMVTAEINRIKNIDAEEDGAKIMGFGLNYWKSLNEINTPEICAELEIPFLVMQGGADFQIFPEEDYEAWKTVFEGRENVVFKFYENLNHLFMPTSGIRGLADYSIESNVDQRVIEDITAWINELPLN